MYMLIYLHSVIFVTELSEEPSETLYNDFIWAFILFFIPPEPNGAIDGQLPPT